MNVFLPYILTIIATIFSGLVLWWFKKDRLALCYNMVASDTFPIGSNQGKVFIIEIKNKGNKIVEDCNLEITFNQGEISGFKFSNEKLISDLSHSSQQILSKIPFMNPNEILKLTITTLEKPSILTPIVILRAKGITAKQESGNVVQLSTQYLSAITIIVIILSIILSSIPTVFFSGTSKELAKLKNELKGTEGKLKKGLDELKELEEQRMKGKPERQDYIFSIINKAGLSHIFPKLIASSEDITYKNTGFFLFYSFLIDDKNRPKYIDAMNRLVENENVAPSSKGIIFYLLAKMEQYNENELKYKEYLKKCEKEAPLMYQHLIDQDSAFNVKSLQQWLLKNWK